MSLDNSSRLSGRISLLALTALQYYSVLLFQSLQICRDLGKVTYGEAVVTQRRYQTSVGGDDDIQPAHGMELSRRKVCR